MVQVLEETHFQYEGYALWKIEGKSSPLPLPRYAGPDAYPPLSDDSSVLYWSGDHEKELKFAFPHVGDYKVDALTLLVMHPCISL